MTDTPIPDWVLLEAARRCGWDRADNTIEDLRYMYSGNPVYAALCDMILKHEQPPVDRKLLCAREANRLWENSCEGFCVEDACVRAIELYLEGYGK